MRRRRLIGILGSLLLLCGGFAIWTQVSLVGDLVLRNLLGQSAAYITDASGRVVAILPRELDHHRNPRDKSQDIDELDGTLNFLVRVFESEGLDAAAGIAPMPGPEFGSVAVAIYQELFLPGTGTTAEIAESLRALGVEPDSVDDTFLSAFVPIPLLREIAQIEHVQHVAAPIPGWPEQRPNPIPAATGTTVENPAQIHGADAWHAAGLTGQGIRVGIIDMGFGDYANAMSRGDVPQPSGCSINGDDRNQISDCFQRDPHGTAVAEAVTHIAPDVEIYLALVSGTPETVFAATEWLANQKVHIINQSLGHLWEGPGDGTSPYPKSTLHAVDHAVSNHATWINSAGNYNQQTWFGPLRHGTWSGEVFESVSTRFREKWKTQGYRFDHVFGKPKNVKLAEVTWWPGDTKWWLPGNTCNTLSLEFGEDMTFLRYELEIYLRWDDNWGSPTTDLDIHVYSPWGGRIHGEREITVKTAGEERQSPGGIPREVFKMDSRWGVTSGDYCVQIHNYSKAQGLKHATPQWVQLRAVAGKLEANGMHSLEGTSESANPGMLSVGAAGPNPNPVGNYTIARYSSRGPVVDGRNRPDLVGIAGAHSEVYRHAGCRSPDPLNPNFCAFEGTSQAAPHVAGLAALVKQKFPNHTPTQVADYLRTNAVPQSNTSIHDWGYGLAHLPPPSLVAAPVAAVEVGCVDGTGFSVDLAGDKQLLINIRDRLRGDNTSLLTNWNENTPVEYFDGVSVSGNPSRVTALSLNSWSSVQTDSVQPSTLVASLGNAVQSLSKFLVFRPVGAAGQLNLPAFWFAANPHAVNAPGPMDKLQGTIPPELANLCRLEVLDLSWNRLTGSIPPELGRLVYLEKMDLSHNRLSGSIPPEIGQLTQLDTLTLRFNFLTGDFPQGLQNLCQQGQLSFDFMELAGEGICVSDVCTAMSNSANPTTSDANDGSALRNAVRDNDGSLVQCMLAAGANANARGDHSGTPLHVAAYGGNADTVKLLLAAGANAKETDGSGRTPLHIAANSVDQETLAALLAAGSDINERDGQGQTALHIAAQWSHAQSVETLLAAGANVNERSNRGHTPLHVAAKGNSRSPMKQDQALTVETLLAAGANVHEKDDGGQTPLHAATGMADQATVETLLAAGANVHEKDARGQTPLHAVAAATFGGRADIAKILLAAGANVHERDDQGHAALYNAAHWGNADTVKLLLAAGANVNERDTYGYTPLHTAAYRSKAFRGNTDTVELLLAAGANVEAKTDRGETPLYEAARSASAEAVETLLAAGANVNAKDDQGWMPLYLAADRANPETVAALLAAGANVNERTDGGSTALHRAAYRGSADTLKLLLAAGANIYADNDGRTPLHLAAVPTNQTTEALEVLLLTGANINAKDNHGYTPLHVAAQSASAETLETFLAAGANINAKNDFGNTPLHEAADRGGHADNVKTLLTAGANVNAKNDFGYTPLHIAVRYGSDHVKKVEFLLAAGADVNIQANDGRTALGIATDKSDEKVVELLLAAGAKADGR